MAKLTRPCQTCGLEQDGWRACATKGCTTEICFCKAMEQLS